MPHKGFKSITLHANTYDDLDTIYQNNKDDLRLRGIRSFSGYITSLINESVERDRQCGVYQTDLQFISIAGNTVLIKDFKVERIAELKAVKQKLKCYLCVTENCIHCGFAYSRGEVLKLLGSQKV